MIALLLAWLRPQRPFGGVRYVADVYRYRELLARISNANHPWDRRTL